MTVSQTHILNSPDPLAVELNNRAMHLVQDELVSRRPNKHIIKQAVQLLDSANAIDSAFRLAYSNKIPLLCLLGKIDEIIETIEALMTNCPTNPMDFIQLATAYQAKGMSVEVTRTLNTALAQYEISPDSAYYLESMGYRVLMYRMLNNPVKVDSLIRILDNAFLQHQDAVNLARSFFSEFKYSEWKQGALCK